MKSKLFFITLIFLAFFGGLWASRFLKQMPVAVANVANFDDQSAKYPLLAKRILLENPNDIIINFSLLRTNLKKITGDWGSDFSFYFEYLPTGTSIGVNEKVEYNPMSLVKVPIAMAYYYVGAKQGLDFNPTVTIKPEEVDKGSGELWQKGAGYQISLKDAAKLALVASDNTATQVIADNIPLVDYREMFLGLDIPVPDDKNLLKLSTKEYSSILKSLYFSSVLDKGDSQEVLNYLVESPLEDGLKSGVRTGVPVANKVGILADQLYQDCGIVYVPKRQYLLCMFSKGDESLSKARMTQVSKTVYDYVVSVNGKD
jgi:beta-lactamase class A